MSKFKKMHNWIKYMQTATTSNRLNVCIVRTINYGSCICSFILACVPLQGGIWYLHLLKNILQSPWHCSLLQRVSRLWKNRKRRNRLLNVIAAETLLDSGCYKYVLYVFISKNSFSSIISIYILNQLFLKFWPEVISFTGIL